MINHSSNDIIRIYEDKKELLYQINIKWYQLSGQHLDSAGTV